MNPPRRTKKDILFALLFIIFFNLSNLYAFTKPQPMIEPVIKSDLAVTTTQEKVSNKPETQEQLPQKQKEQTAENIINTAHTKAKIESITLTYSDDLYATQKPKGDDHTAFVKDLMKFTSENITSGQTEARAEEAQKKPKKEIDRFWFIFPRISFIKKSCADFMTWFHTKDKNYHGNGKSARLRREWEVLMGVDVFHPYYKYKEARRAIKEKFTFDTPEMLPHFPRMKIRPEYEDDQLKVTFSKKF